MPESTRERLIREQNETWTRMQEIMAAAERDGRDLSADEARNFDQANDRLTAIDREMQRADVMSQREQIDRSQIVEGGGQPTAPEGDRRSQEQIDADYRDAFSAYLRDGLGEDSSVTPEQRRLLAANRVESRALGQGTPQGGGFLVPPEHRDDMTRVVDEFGGMLPYCHQITTATGAPLMWPMTDDTMNEGVEISENTQVGEQDTTFDEREIGAFIYTSKMVRVPWSLQQDTAFNLDNHLTTIFGERLGRVYAKRLLTGSGNGQPLGLLAPSRIGAATRPLKIGVTTPVGSEASIQFDDFIELEHAVSPAYRNRDRARYMLSDDALKMSRLLKDGEGRPLWVPIPAPGFAATINGHPYFVDNSMAEAAPGGIGAVFGDFYAGMLVRIVQGFQAVRLTERYADLMQTGYFAYSRMDATPDDPKALAAMRFGASA
jgi:HK97 family phage major capsid protein